MELDLAARCARASIWRRAAANASLIAAYPSDPASRRTPCPPKFVERWLQVRLGCLRLSPSCPFRLLHTFLSLRPARHYPRFWIRACWTEPSILPPSASILPPSASGHCPIRLRLRQAVTTRTWFS